MASWLKVFGVAALSLVGLGASAVGAGNVLADRKMQRKVSVPARSLALSEDESVLAHGRYLFESRGCAECHGADGAGRKFIDEDGMLVRAPERHETSSGQFGSPRLGPARAFSMCWIPSSIA